ncbi:MAG: DUF5074 domain-containing protein [Bergeyella zoohelcum]|nr:DUF5074 domain-containing protein [Bergeyella zoohelcum]
MTKKKYFLAALLSLGLGLNAQDFSNGVFILNEDQWGTFDSSLNFLDNSGNFTYNVFQQQNGGTTLGTTTQFGAIYGDQFFFLSKQPGKKDSHSGRFTVANASTLVRTTDFDTLSTLGEGRSFVGVSADKGYIGTSEGILVYDIKNQTIGNSIAESLNKGQVGNMIRGAKYVFAVMQSGGILVINPETDAVIKTFSGNYTRVAQSKSGDIWLAKEDTMEQINQYTLEVAQSISYPTGIKVRGSWGAWNAGSFCASNQNNVLYLTNNGEWSTGTQIIKYDIDKNEFATIYTLSDSALQFYGAGIRINPKTDEIIANVAKGYEPINWVYKLDNSGNLISTHQLKEHYWFPAMPIFPDNDAPVVSDQLQSQYTIKEETTIDLKTMATDTDNLSAAIVKSVEVLSGDTITANINSTDELVITPTKNGTAKIKVTFNSNGKLVSKEIEIVVAGLSVNDVAKSAFKVYPNPATDFIRVSSEKEASISIFDLTGKLIKQGNTQGKTFSVSALPKGLYLLKVEADGQVQTSKLIIK